MTVLFVDDEPQALQAIDELLLEVDADWDCAFALTGKEAIAMLDEYPIEAIVTDLRMPGMDGAMLLNYVSEHYPKVVRIVTSQRNDRELVLRAVECMHQFLPKPCTAMQLKSTVDRACCVRDLLISDALQRLIGGLSKLPSVPEVYRRLTRELCDEDASIQSLGKIVAEDAAMTAKVLQIVNSAIFCLGHQVSDPVKAVSLLGASTLKSLVLAIGIFREFERMGTDGFTADTLMHHCLRAARVAKAIGYAESLDEDSLEDAITAATLHDIGKLVLFSVDPQSYNQAARIAETRGVEMWRAERQVFGADHAAVGAYLLSIWGLPQRIVEIVALHHMPTRAFEMSFSPLSAVVSANFLCHHGGPATLPDPGDELTRYFEMVACGGRLQSWNELTNWSPQAARRGNTPLPSDVSL